MKGQGILNNRFLAPNKYRHKMGKRIVVKVGSNVLTREDGKLDVTRMSAIVDQIVWLRKHDYEVILVSSGAVAAGRAEPPS